MPRPRISLAQASATGAMDKNPQRFRGRNEPLVSDPIGEPPEWMNDAQRASWRVLTADLPWLNKSHRAHVSIAVSIHARLISGEDVGIQALNLLRQCLSQMGATPSDASKISIPDVGEDDPSDEFFSTLLNFEVFLPTTIICSGPGFHRNSIRFIHDVTAGLQGHFIFGGTAGQSSRNLVGGKVSGAFVGVPTFTDDHALLGPAGYFDTRIPETDNMTVLVVGRTPLKMPGPRHAYFASTNAGPAVAGGRNSNGFSLYFSGDATLRFFAARWNGSANTPSISTLGDNEPRVPSSEWSLIAGRCNAAGSTLDDLTVGRPQTQATANDASRDPNTNTVLIGARYGALDTIGSVQIQQAMIFSGRLSDVDLARAAAQMRSIATLSSITV